VQPVFVMRRAVGETDKLDVELAAVSGHQVNTLEVAGYRMAFDPLISSFDDAASRRDRGITQMNAKAGMLELRPFTLSVLHAA